MALTVDAQMVTIKAEINTSSILSDGVDFFKSFFQGGVCLKRPNQSVRDDLEMLGIHQWQVAQALNVSETTFCRWMRTPLSVKRLEQVYVAINKVRDERNRRV